MKFEQERFEFNLSIELEVKRLQLFSDVKRVATRMIKRRTLELKFKWRGVWNDLEQDGSVRNGKTSKREERAIKKLKEETWLETSHATVRWGIHVRPSTGPAQVAVLLLLLTSWLCMLPRMSGRVPFLAAGRTQHGPMTSSGECTLLYCEDPPSSCSRSQVWRVLPFLSPATHDGTNKP